MRDPVREVLDALLGCCQLLPQHPTPRGVLQRTLSEELEQRSTRARDSSTERRHHLFGLLHCRSSGDLVSSGRVHSKKVRLDKRGEHRLGGTSSDDQIELLDQSNLDGSFLVVAAVVSVRGNVDRPFHEVVPAEDLLGPELEGEQEVEVRSVRQGHFALTEPDETLHHLIVIEDVGVGDERIDAVHLQ
jgi:hypothetical protein